jgi:small subunit ribosomal protein S9
LNQDQEEQRDAEQSAADEASAESSEAPSPEGAETDDAAAESAESPDATEGAEVSDATESAEGADATEGAEGHATEESADAADVTEEAPPDVAAAEVAPPPTPVDLGPDARYFATGKRKSSVARVIVRPGSGAFDLNGRSIDDYFPRAKHRAVVRQPLEVSGYVERVDVRARIHGGGVGGQADALRHGIAKALIEADPHLRGELKRRQLLTRDPRVKERRKAGLKKARKRPQFSKR